MGRSLFITCSPRSPAVHLRGEKEDYLFGFCLGFFFLADILYILLIVYMQMILGEKR